MANIVRIRRRTSGMAGAPSSLKTAELAHNAVDDTLYIGKGDDGSGNATSIVPVGGEGAFMDLNTNQTINGKKFFTQAPDSLADATVSTGLVRKAQLDLKANIASPSFTGTPTAPTQSTGDNTTKIATTQFVYAALNSFISNGEISLGELGDVNTTGAAFTGDVLTYNGTTGMWGASTPSAAGLATESYVNTQISNVINAAPAALDTLNELAAALGDDPNFAATITGQLALKAPLASPALTGNPTAPTQAAGNSSTRIATTAFVQTAIGSATIDGGTF